MYTTVLVPFPLTPLSAFGYFLCQRFNKISPAAVSVYHWRPASPLVRIAWQSPDILLLMGKDLRVRLEKLIADSVPVDQTRKYKRLLNYIASPGRSEHLIDVYRLGNVISDSLPSPEPALRVASNVFVRALKTGEDPFKSGLTPCEVPDVVHAPHPVVPPSKVYVTLPRFDESPAPYQKVIGYDQSSLEESNVANLVSQNITLVVGGPPGSGKSTATTTLVDEMCNIVQSLRTRAGWSEFNLSIQYVNLDKGTPTGQYILDQSGKDTELVQSAKRQWTPEMAREGLLEILAAKQTTNIIVADLPGKIDGLTRMLSCGADGSIILTRDWDKMNEWKNFFGEMGLPHLAQAMTRLPEEGLMSTVKRYAPGRLLSGRITGLDRVVCSWDPFLHFLAKVLLFDLLPTLVASRQQIIDKFRHDI